VGCKGSPRSVTLQGLKGNDILEVRERWALHVIQVCVPVVIMRGRLFIPSQPLVDVLELEGKNLVLVRLKFELPNQESL
jgi:hypothetical protein